MAPGHEVSLHSKGPSPTKVVYDRPSSYGITAKYINKVTFIGTISSCRYALANRCANNSTNNSRFRIQIKHHTRGQRCKGE